MIRRLRIKFVCINMVIVTAMLCVILGMVVYFTQKGMEAESIRMIQGVASLPGRPGRGEAPGRELNLPYFILEISPQGEILATGGNYYELPDGAVLEELKDAALSSGAQTGVLAEYSLRYCRAAMPGGEKLVFADVTSEKATMSSLVKSCALIGILSFLAFLVMSLLLARWAVKPVERAWDQQKQFAADASHELKTPLTVIMTNAELLCSPGYDESARARFAESILAMAHQMRGLVESLLELARADKGVAREETVEVDASGLVSNAVLPFEPLYFESGLELESEVEEGLRLRGVPERLRQVVDILLDNAAKYSHAGTTVRVSLKRQGRHILLAVSNHGEALRGREPEDIFKRFYRADKARSMNHSYGLGLSIARTIVRSHRGRIWAESREGVNTFFVQLPAL